MSLLEPVGNPAAVTNPNTLISNLGSEVINILLALAGGLAVIYLIWAGFQMISSSGNQDRMKAGRTGIINAVIGIIVIVTTYFIIQLSVNIGGSILNSTASKGTTTVTQPVTTTYVCNQVFFLFCNPSDTGLWQPTPCDNSNFWTACAPVLSTGGGGTTTTTGGGGTTTITQCDPSSPTLIYLQCMAKNGGGGTTTTGGGGTNCVTFFDCVLGGGGGTTTTGGGGTTTTTGSGGTNSCNPLTDPNSCTTTTGGGGTGLSSCDNLTGTAYANCLANLNGGGTTTTTGGGSTGTCDPTTDPNGCLGTTGTSNCDTLFGIDYTNCINQLSGGSGGTTTTSCNPLTDPNACLLKNP